METIEFPDRERLSLQADVRDALAAVYSGADMTDAAALIDQLEDRGMRVTRA